MAKDPAFLWYPNDYIGGTMGMTFEEKGAYIELLMMQFNRGHMTSHMIGQKVGQLWDTIKVKFSQDDKGLWYNVRLEEEKNKRQKFTESRRNNVSGANQYSKKKKTKVGHTTSHMEDEDRNVNEVKSVSEKKEIIFPFDSIEFMKWWGYWKEYKLKEHGFKYKSEVSEQAALKKLTELSDAIESDAVKIIEQSIANGWKGFFAVKNEAQSSSDMDEYKRKLKERIGDGH